MFRLLKRNSNDPQWETAQVRILRLSIVNFFPFWGPLTLSEVLITRANKSFDVCLGTQWDLWAKLTPRSLGLNFQFCTHLLQIARFDWSSKMSINNHTLNLLRIKGVQNADNLATLPLAYCDYKPRLRELGIYCINWDNSTSNQHFNGSFIWTYTGLVL